MEAHTYFNQWRSVCRSLWNETYISIIIEHGGATELEEEFCKIEQLLFSSIVLYQLKDDVAESDFLDDHMNIAPRVLERFLIVPRAQSMPVMINREMTSRYWDYPIVELLKNEALIGFVHYYDFCAMDTPRKYQYVRGRILESSKYSEIVGKDLLVAADLSWIVDKKETEQPNVGDGEGYATPNNSVICL